MTDMAKCLLEACQLGFCYDGKPYLFRAIDFKLYSGQILGITGASGCGKTSLCYCLCGIIPHIRQGGCLEGQVILSGQPVVAQKPAMLAKQIGVVFQNSDIQLFSDAVEGDIAFGMENICLPWAEMDKRLQQVLSVLQIEDLRYADPNLLSGGQKQLVAIATVLAMGTDVIILDEAMSQLDYSGTRRLQEGIVALKNLGKAIIMVEHDEDNLQIADYVIDLGAGRL